MKKKDTKKGKDQELYIGLVRLHVLHHAAEEPVFGLGMIQELGRHGYKLGRERCIRCCMGWSTKAG